MKKTTTASTLFDLDNVEMDQFVRDSCSGDVYHEIVLAYWPIISPGSRVEFDDPGEFEKSLGGLLSSELSSAVMLNDLGLGGVCDYEVRCMLTDDGAKLQPSSTVIDKLKSATMLLEDALDTYMSELAEPVKKTGLEEGEFLRSNARFIALSKMWEMANQERTLSIEKLIDESELVTSRSRTVELYHISFDDNLPNTLTPQLPAGGDLSEPEHWSTEPDIPRVCFSESIEGCVRAVYPNLTKVFENDPGDGVTFNLYRAVSKKGRFVSPYVLDRVEAVHDVNLTDEWWSLNPIEIEPMGKINVKVDINGEWVKHKPTGQEVEYDHSPKHIEITML